MGDLLKIVLTACFTIIGGVLLLVITQIFTRFVIDPLTEFRRLLGEVAYTLILNATLLYNPATTANTPEFQEAKRQCRALANRLHASSAAVPLYELLARINLVPPLSNVHAASTQLIALSNTRATHPTDVVGHHYTRISELLRIRVDSEPRPRST